MDADPNWLLSTTVQSTAALVGIVGGLLISRLVSLSSERAGLMRRLQAVERDETAARTMLDDAYRLTVAMAQAVDEMVETGQLVLGPHDRYPQPYVDARSKHAAAHVSHQATVDLVSIARGDLDLRQQPQSLKNAVGILGLFSLLGIAYPSILMASGPTQLSTVTRISVVAAFLVGLSGLLLYLLRSGKALTKTD